VTCTAVDDAGNEATCSFDVIVEDNEDPVIGDCPEDVTKCADASGTATVNWNNPTAVDNCGPPSVSCNPASGSMFQPGETTVTCTATDSAGNTDTCSFMVTVVHVNSIDPDCPNVGVGSRIGLTANVTPSGRVMDWTFVGTPPPGCSLAPTGDLTADFTAGNDNGTVTVKACDSEISTCCATISLAVVGACPNNLNVTPSVAPGSVACTACCSDPDVTSELAIKYPIQFPGDADLTACYNAQYDTWYPRLKSVKVSYQSYFCNTYQTVIHGADDPLIEANSYCIAVEDFIPSPGYHNFYAYNCEVVGQETWAAEFRTKFLNTWPSYEAQIEALPVGFYCNSADTVDRALQNLQSQINDKLKDAEDLAFAQIGYDPNNPMPTPTALGARNGCLQDLAVQICNLWNDPPDRSCSSCPGQGN
jgi:hypothetical protein